MVDFGAKLKTLRKEAGITQTELAERLGVTKAAVSYYELQERIPSPDIIVRLAKIFHTTTDYLFGIEHQKMIDVTGLTDEDVKFILLAVETLRRKNEK